MARYIDVEKIKLTANTMVDDSGEVYVALSDVRKAIALAPTADVAPRAELEKIFWEIDKLLTMVYTDDEDGRKFIGVDMQKYYDLKKKYTEGQK